MRRFDFAKVSTFLICGLLAMPAMSQEASQDKIAAEVAEGESKQPSPRAATAIASGVVVPFNLPAVTATTQFTGDYSFTIPVPAGATEAKFELVTQTLNADVDLYVRRNLDVERLPNGRPLADYISEGLTGNETITVPSPPSGTYYIAFGLFTLNRPVSATIKATITAPPPPTSGNYNGTWNGTTGQGRQISFTVANNIVTQIVYSVNWSAGSSCPTGSTTTANVNLPIVNNSFSNSTITASLSGNSASGTLRAVLSIPPPQNCNQVVNTTWTASLGTPPVQTSYSITGQVRDGSGNPLSSVSLTLSGGASDSTQTSASGDYSFSGLPAGLGYNVTPSRAGCTFSPSNRSYNGLAADQASQNFTGSCPVTITIQPQNVTLYPSQSQTFNISVSPASSVALSTSLNPSLGSLDLSQFSGCLRGGSCLYTAPASINAAQTITLASTVVGGTGNASATISLQPCSYTLSTNNLNLTNAASSTTVTVTTQTPCQWNANTSASWLTITGGTGAGNGSFTIAASANTGGSRTATINFNGASSQVVNVTQSATPPPSSPLRFVPVTPCRILETRAVYAGPTWTGAFGPPRLSAGSTRTIPVTSSPNCNIPPSAKAFVFNVTVDTVQDATGPVDAVIIWPTGEPRPIFRTVSTTTGGYIANGAIVKAGSNGSVDVYSTHNTNLLLDINGYFTDEASGLLFYPFGPCRAVDTRGPVYSSLPPPFGNSKLTRGKTRTFTIPQSPNCQIPAATAYSFQMTLAPGDLTNGLPVAYVTAWPSDRSQPIISNMNSLFGHAVANSGIVPARSDGSIDVFAYDATNLILDVNGYFAPDDGSGRGLYYYPVTQCRILNTMDPSFTGPFGPPLMTPLADRTVPIPASAQCPGLPASAKAWALNATATPNGSPMPFLSMWPDATVWPGVSQLNAFQGQTVSNSAIVPVSPAGAFLLKVNGSTHVTIEAAGYFGR